VSGAAALDSGYAWARLAACLAIGTLGGAGMWCVVVVIPVVQAEFAASRADVASAYTALMLGFCAGGIAMGRVVDTKGAPVAIAASAVLLGAGFALAGSAPTLTVFALAHGLLIGLGSAATFAPLVADISHWFVRRRGIAIAICASGNYLAGAIWPPAVELLMRDWGWRTAYITIGLACVAAMLPLALALRRKAPSAAAAAQAAATQSGFYRPPPLEARPLGLSPGALMALLAVAGLGCCVAMSTPQVHIVALCADLGFGVARGAEMLSLMLGFGIVSRVASGWIADRVGGVKTLLLGSTLQGVALVLYAVSDSLVSLYIVSALFGLFQGGIVPSYALIVREYFPAEGSATRVSIAVSATIIGMALGGWMGGVMFDLTGSYKAAFVNGIAWNVLNSAIAWWLLIRQSGRLTPRAA